MCNLNCEYCYVDIGPDAKPNWSDSIDRKYLLKYDHIKFFWWEPLLKWKEITSIIDSIQTKKISKKYTIITNGVLVTPEKLSYIKEHRIALVTSIHPSPWARALKKQITDIIDTLDMRLHDFIFVLSPKTLQKTYQGILFMISIWVKNFHITPDSSQLWNWNFWDLLVTTVSTLEKISLKIPDLNMRFWDIATLQDPSISCKKTIEYNGKIEPCNRFSKKWYLNKELFVQMRRELEKIWYFSHPYRFFFSCPIGFFLDHIGQESREVAQQYIKINELFIETEKRISSIKKITNYLTAHPDDLRFNLNNQCNLRCRYCYVQFDNATYDFHDIVRTFCHFHERWIYPSCVSFFWGEPLLSFETLEKSVHYIEKKYQETSFDIPTFKIATNVTILTQTTLQFLQKHNFQIHISLWWIQSVHDVLRFNTFEQVHQKLRQYNLYDNPQVVFLLMIDEKFVATLAKSYIFLSYRGCKKIHLECIFSTSQSMWEESSIDELKRQCMLIRHFDGGVNLVGYQSDKNFSVYDIGTNGSISTNSLDFHGTYSLDMKKVLDSIMGEIFESL